MRGWVELSIYSQSCCGLGTGYHIRQQIDVLQAMPTQELLAVSLALSILLRFITQRSTVKPLQLEMAVFCLFLEEWYGAERLGLSHLVSSQLSSDRVRRCSTASNRVGSEDSNESRSSTKSTLIAWSWYDFQPFLMSSENTEVGKLRECGFAPGKSDSVSQ